MGRKPKEILSLEEQEDVVIYKVYTGETLTLEETAIALWMYDGRPKSGPMSKIQVYNYQQRILAKCKQLLSKKGINRSIINDIIGDKNTEYLFELER